MKRTNNLTIVALELGPKEVDDRRNSKGSSGSPFQRRLSKPKTTALHKEEEVPGMLQHFPIAHYLYMFLSVFVQHVLVPIRFCDAWGCAWLCSFDLCILNMRPELPSFTRTVGHPYQTQTATCQNPERRREVSEFMSPPAFCVCFSLIQDVPIGIKALYFQHRGIGEFLIRE